MDVILFLRKVLEKLSESRNLYAFFFWMMRIAALVFVGYSLVDFFLMFKLFRYLEFGEILLIFLFGCVMILINAWLVFQVLWLRAENIRTLGEPDYPVLRIAAPVSRAVGEVLAIEFLVAGFTAMMFAWFHLSGSRFFGPFLSRILPLGSDPFTLGLSYFLSGVLSAVIAWFSMYLVAECCIWTVEVVLNLRKKNT